MKAKVGILSLGCPRNLVDSESLLGRLKVKGYKIVDIEEADVALVNTCAFIIDAKEESVDAILDLIARKKEGKLRKIIVYGCLSQRYKEELSRELPEIDAFVGKVNLGPSGERFAISPKYSAYLKICEGCVNLCSFCIIPKIKGKLSSLDANSILQQTEAFNREQISELNIIGQDITGYGLDLAHGLDLNKLLIKIIKKADRINWIRLLYLNPAGISDALLKTIAEHKKICKYIDLPIQHINNRILKLMNRRGTKKDIISLIEKIRKMIPGVALRSSLIVGFPSESDKEFNELLKFIKEIKFERLGVFSYSREESTAAYSFKGQLSDKIKRERLDLMMTAQQKISLANNTRFLGKILEVLVDEEDNGAYTGRTQFDAPEVDGMVYIQGARKKLFPGDFVKVKITDTLEYDLVGEVE